MTVFIHRETRHTHTHLTVCFQVSRYQNGKTNLDFCCSKSRRPNRLVFIGCIQFVMFQRLSVCSLFSHRCSWLTGGAAGHTVTSLSTQTQTWTLNRILTQMWTLDSDQDLDLDPNLDLDDIDWLPDNVPTACIYNAIFLQLSCSWQEALHVISTKAEFFYSQWIINWVHLK